MFGICANVQFPFLHVHNWAEFKLLKSAKKQNNHKQLTSLQFFLCSSLIIIYSTHKLHLWISLKAGVTPCCTRGKQRIFSVHNNCQRLKLQKEYRWDLTVLKQQKMGQHKRAGTFLVHWHRYLCPGNGQKIMVWKSKRRKGREKKISIIHGSWVYAKNVFCVAQLKKVDIFFFIQMLAVN